MVSVIFRPLHKTRADFAIQMLANIDSSMMMHTTGLADDSTLCAKKDHIIDLFDQLLKKLGGEVNYNFFGLKITFY